MRSWLLDISPTIAILVRACFAYTYTRAYSHARRSMLINTNVHKQRPSFHVYFTALLLITCEGTEREMAICHQQPHLVPPMRLVVYDDLPSPDRINRPPMAPKWVSKGRSLAAKTTGRAMKSIREVTVTGKSAKRPSISGPSDFIHVNSQSSRQTDRFYPLELSIHLPGNELPELPEFSSFDANDPGWLAPPPNALPSPFTSAFERYSNAESFKIPRKPLNPTAHHSLYSRSIIGPTHLRRTTLPEPLLSVRETPEPGYADNRGRRQSETLPDRHHHGIIVEDRRLCPGVENKEKVHRVPPPLRPPTEKQPHLATADKLSPRVSSFDPPYRSSRHVARWLLQGSSTSSSPVQANFRPSPFVHSRSRTLSGSTLSGRTPSLTSAATASTIYPLPPLPGHADKESDFPIFATPCPTVYEGKGQFDQANGSGAVNGHRRFNSNDIGMAF